MQVYIMRHGEAEGFTNQSFHSDSERPLTKQGMFEAQLMADWLTKMNISLNHIFVSPFVRAQQTCELVLKKMNTDAITLDFITPAGDARQVHDFIDGLIGSLDDDESHDAIAGVTNAAQTQLDQQCAVLLVSHMPLVSYLVAEMTYDDNAPIFATAAIAQIDYDPNTMKGEFIRMVSPLDLC